MGIEFSLLLEKSGEELWKWINEIESDDIFKKITGSKNFKNTLTITSVHFCPCWKNNPQLSSTRSIESMFNGNFNIIELIKKIGEDKFSYYFFDKCGSLFEISKLLGISFDQIKEYRNMAVQYRDISSIGQNSAAAANPYDLNYSHINRRETAAIVFAKNQKLSCFPVRKRDRYIINKDKLNEIYQSNFLNKEEAKQFKLMINRLETVNRRFKLLEDIVMLAVEHQKDFLAGSDLQKLKEFTGRQAADMLNISPSWVSRLLKHKDIVVNEQRLPLKDLFVSQKSIDKQKGMDIVRIVLEEEKQRLREKSLLSSYSAENIRLIIKKRFQLDVSRKTINNWRNEIELEKREYEH